MSLKELFKPLFILSIIVLIIVIASLLADPTWLDAPWKWLALMGIAIPAALKFANDLMDFLKKWQELKKPKQPPSIQAFVDRNRIVGLLIEKHREGTELRNRGEKLMHESRVEL